MTSEDLQDIILCGETTTVQFKQNFTTQKKIADEMVAFANSRGGMIIFCVEALVHRDLLKPAAIRLLVFDNRIEIINPGSLAGGLTIEEIKLGNSFARNPLLANFCSKTMTYRGLGFGVPRSLKEDVRVEFENDASGNQFTARIWRNLDVQKDVQKETSEPLSERELLILEMIRKNGNIKLLEMSTKLKVNEKTIRRDLESLQRKGKIVRKGGRKEGCWIIITE